MDFASLKVVLLNNEVDMTISKAEMHALLLSSPFSEYYKKHGLDDKLWGEFVCNLFVQLARASASQASQVHAGPDVDVEFLQDDHVLGMIIPEDDFLHIVLVPADETEYDEDDLDDDESFLDDCDFLDDDDDDEMTEIFNQTICDNVSGKSVDQEKDCMKCFLEKVLPDLVMSYQMSPLKTTYEEVLEAVASSDCCKKAIQTFDDAQTVKGFANWLSLRVKELCAKEPNKEVFYQVKNLDAALAAMPYVKYGHILKIKDKYFVASNHDLAVLTEYGKAVRPFAYADSGVICGIRDGNFCKSSDLKDIFDNR